MGPGPFLPLVALLLAWALLPGCSSDPIGPDPPEETPADDPAAYTNPVLDRDFPDPTVIQAADDAYYAYATQGTDDGELIHIQVARSENLVDWTILGDALPQAPVWATQIQNLWAPDVIYDAGRDRYVMYYSAHSDSTNAKCLAVATADDPAGPFVDAGEPLLCGPGFVNIDPMAFDDPVSGRRLLYWGSGFEPIKVRELAPDGMSFAEGSEATPVVYPGFERDYSVLIEGAWVVYRDGWYYLFYSGDNCCGENANYAVMVARARDPLGPFERLGQVERSGSSVILERRGYWRAPGHNSVVTDAAGQDWMVYHAIDPSQPYQAVDSSGNRYDRRVMLMDRLTYRDGWPQIEGGSPSNRPRPSPVVTP